MSKNEVVDVVETSIQPSWSTTQIGHLTVTYHSPSEEEVVFVHVELSSSFKNLGAHLEREQQLVTLKQTTTGVPEEKSHLLKKTTCIVIGQQFFIADHKRLWSTKPYMVFSYDVMAAMLVSPKHETAAMLVHQTNPVEVELVSYLNTFFFLWPFTFLHFLLCQ